MHNKESDSAGPNLFANPWNPSSREIRAWAYAHNAQAPCQDWDLALAWAGHESDYLEFSADANCPNRLYFLHVIYLMVGSAVRNGYRTTPKAWTTPAPVDISRPHNEALSNASGLTPPR